MTAPMLLFNSGKKDGWNFYDLITQKVLNIQVNVPRKQLVGSSKGCKATVSADPILDANDCIVTVIHLESGRLAYFRLGKDTTWTYIEERPDEIVEKALLGFHMVEEVASLGNKLYAVNSYSEVLSFDATTGCSLNTKLVGRGCEPDANDIKHYIFEGENNKLWMVQRYLKFEKDKRVTKKFRVFELNFQTAEWTEKKTLDHVALFLGNNSSVLLLAAELVGFESNCIYFNHDFDYVGIYYDENDFGVYDVEDQCF
uniref:putative F-box protein At5g55150 n=1 Tax=Fragaria vesca subsp. vesca TaxID=101020 RepID=UPI0005C994F5|nr:PREDICTED: putative F-box protein At5g55150 [Fragaria vesca subsp. vesca]